MEGPKVESDHIRGFIAHDFLLVGFTWQTSRTKNKQVISTFKLGYTCLTLKEGHKVKTDQIRRFPANDFLKAGLYTKPLGPIIGDIGTFKVCYMGYFGTPWITLNEELQGQMSASL